MATYADVAAYADGAFGGATFAANLSEPSQRLSDLQNTNQSSSGFGMLFVRVGRLNVTGDVIVPKKLRIFCLMSGAEVDLTGAQFLYPEIEIEVYSMFGGCVVYVPAGLRLRKYELGLSAHVNIKTPFYPTVNGAPTVRIKAMSMFGGVDVNVDVTKPAIRPVTIA